MNRPNQCVDSRMSENLKTDYRSLSSDEIQQLTEQGCICNVWSTVQVVGPFLAERVRGVEFAGMVVLGSLGGEIHHGTASAKPCGVYNARLQDCVIGNGVRIANVGSHIAGYHIDDNVLIENV